MLFDYSALDTKPSLGAYIGRLVSYYSTRLVILAMEYWILLVKIIATVTINKWKYPMYIEK